MDALCALLDCALGFFPCYFLFGCNRLDLTINTNTAQIFSAGTVAHIIEGREVQGSSACIVQCIQCAPLYIEFSPDETRMRNPMAYIQMK